MIYPTYRNILYLSWTITCILYLTNTEKNLKTKTEINIEIRHNPLETAAQQLPVTLIDGLSFYLFVICNDAEFIIISFTSLFVLF